tara:strand:- start:15722 stop:18316 length:2595 start_codon:yes stop_codon:yes gene_type:complete
MKGANSKGTSGSNSERTKPGAHEVGFFLSPREKILEKRSLELTSLESGRLLLDSSIGLASEAYSLKHSKVEWCRLDVREVRAGLLAALFVLASLSSPINAQDSSKEILMNDNLVTNGTVWIGFTCREVACHGMELIVSLNGVETVHEDPHFVQWSGFVVGNVSWTLLADSGVTVSEIRLEMIFNWDDEWTELVDLPDVVAAPGSQDEFSLIDTISPHQFATYDNPSFDSLHSANCDGYGQCLFPSSENSFGALNADNDYWLPGNTQGTVEEWYDSIQNCKAYNVTTEVKDCDFEWSDGILYVGALENKNDKDAVMITGNPGDIILINSLRGPGDISIEIWERGNEVKSLIETLDKADLEHYLEYPADGELWIRIVDPSEEEYSPYELEIIRYDQNYERLSEELAASPIGEFFDGEFLPFKSQVDPNKFLPILYRGHVGSSDSDGDSLKFSSGAKIRMEASCSFTGDINVQILLHGINGSILPLDVGCNEIFETSADTDSVEIIMTTQNITAGWALILDSLDSGDGNMIGDAPDVMWSETEPYSYWGPLVPGPVGASPYSGSVGIGDSIDIHPFEISDENGSMVLLNSVIDSRVTYQIQSLDQETWQILNYTNGTVISLPKGIHAIRVEGLFPIMADVTYSFVIVYLGEDVPDEGEYRDLSHLFTNFYVLIGIIMLLPLAVVTWWNRSSLFGARKNEYALGEHEIRRLRSLRERLSISAKESEIDQEDVENALRKLGDSPWEGVLGEWGEPLLNYMTEQIEICSWGVPGGDFLIVGIRTFESEWKLAAMSVGSPEGSHVTVRGVSPSHLFEDGEIFLDSLAPHSKKFLRLTIGGDPSSIELEVSGLVEGESLAAVPRQALVWEEE